MKKGILAIWASLCISVIVIAFSVHSTTLNLAAVPQAAQEADTPPLPEPEIKYGMIMDSLDMFEEKVQRNQTLTDILSSYNLPHETIYSIFNLSKPVYNLGNIQAGNHYRVYLARDSAQSLKCFVYEANPIDHIVVKLEDTPQVFKEERQVDTLVKQTGGVITSSLYETLVSSGASPDLAVSMAEVYAWQVDFFRMFEGDNYKVIYEEISVDSTPIKTGRILAAVFQQHGNTYYAFNFDEDGKEAFFDEEGKSVKGAFLRAPLKYFRITSRFSRSRFHPVLKRYKSHLGTDYAAPYGTPILAVGNGQVIEARYSRFNGNYVKIRHNSTYTTQYLHMSKIARGIRRGARVSQGQVIGYVGSTGLATGPHVCFRFWKNGRQVDPRKQKVIKTEKLKKEYQEAFDQYRDEMMEKLNAIPLDTVKQES